jgi:hypothetical protein
VSSLFPIAEEETKVTGKSGNQAEETKVGAGAADDTEDRLVVEQMAKDSQERERRLTKVTCVVGDCKSEVVTPTEPHLVEGQTFEVPSLRFLLERCTHDQPYLTKEQLASGLVVIGPFQWALSVTTAVWACQVQHKDRCQLSSERSILFFDPACFEHDNEWDRNLIYHTNFVHDKVQAFGVRDRFRGDRFWYAEMKNQYSKQVLPRNGFPFRPRLPDADVIEALAKPVTWKSADEIIVSKIYQVLKTFKGQGTAAAAAAAEQGVPVADVAVLVFSGQDKAAVKARDVEPFAMQMARLGLVVFVDGMRRSLLRLV